MKFNLHLFLLTIIAFTMAGCSDEHLMDTKLIKGQWTLVADDATSSTIYEFATPSEQTRSWGTLTVYNLSPSGERLDEKTYDWHISDPNNDSPVYLDITQKDKADDSDIWDDDDRYVIEQLSAKEMTLRKNEVGDSKTRLKFSRVNSNSFNE